MTFTSAYKGKRTRNIFNPESKETYRLSRSKIENFVRCQLCFYLDVRLGVGQPPGFPFNLNSAVDVLLKKEFDIHRAAKSSHPLMSEYGIDAVPFQHKDLDKWRENFVGVQYLYVPTNFLITGAVDDVWVNPGGELLVVDYKSTSKDSEVNLDADWQDGYKRQMEIYQWLLRQNKFKVSNTGYFVYANGRRDRKAFDGKLEFDVKVISYTGSDTWVEKAIKAARKCLEKDTPPTPDPSCDYCNYRSAASTAFDAFKRPRGLFD
ncbi:MAG: PD-(D/E)XK nuclease family protein [Patescibacteria group bacterium]